MADQSFIKSGGSSPAMKSRMMGGNPTSPADPITTGLPKGAPAVKQDGSADGIAMLSAMKRRMSKA